MGTDDMDWWPLSAALAWIDRRQALPWESWPHDFPMPMLGPSSWHSDRILLPEALKQSFRQKDEGVESALARLSAELIEAMAPGQVRVRGRGPWALLPQEGKTGSASEAAAFPLREIGQEEFTRPGISIFPAGGSIEPGDEPQIPGYGLWLST